jgi:hypothetical protein
LLTVIPVEYSGGKVLVLIDEELLTNLKKEVKFIESGKFDENNGEPTLKVIGSLNSSNIMRVKEKTNINIDYPYFTKDIANDNNISRYQAQTLIHHLGFFGDPRFNQIIKTSKTGKVPKYSKLACDIAKEEISKVETKEEYFNKLSIEYQQRNK